MSKSKSGKKKQSLFRLLFFNDYFVIVESAAAGTAAGAEGALAVSVAVTVGSSSMVLVSVACSFLAQLVTIKPPINAIANNFFIVNLFGGKDIIFDARGSRISLKKRIDFINGYDFLNKNLRL